MPEPPGGASGTTPDSSRLSLLAALLLAHQPHAPLSAPALVALLAAAMLPRIRCLFAAVPPGASFSLARTAGPPREGQPLAADDPADPATVADAARALAAERVCALADAGFLVPSATPHRSSLPCQLSLTELALEPHAHSAAAPRPHDAVHELWSVRPVASAALELPTAVMPALAHCYACTCATEPPVNATPSDGCSTLSAPAGSLASGCYAPTCPCRASTSSTWRVANHGDSDQARAVRPARSVGRAGIVKRGAVRKSHRPRPSGSSGKAIGSAVGSPVGSPVGSSVGHAGERESASASPLHFESPFVPSTPRRPSRPLSPFSQPVESDGEASTPATVMSPTLSVYGLGQSPRPSPSLFDGAWSQPLPQTIEDEDNPPPPMSSAVGSRSSSRPPPMSRIPSYPLMGIMRPPSIFTSRSVDAARKPSRSDTQGSQDPDLDRKKTTKSLPTPLPPATRSSLSAASSSLPQQPSTMYQPAGLVAAQTPPSLLHPSPPLSQASFSEASRQTSPVRPEGSPSDRLHAALQDILAYRVVSKARKEWSELVCPVLTADLSHADKTEMKRQNTLFELFYNHVSFVADLRLLCNTLLPALQSGDLPASPEMGLHDVHRRATGSSTASTGRMSWLPTSPLGPLGSIGSTAPECAPPLGTSPMRTALCSDVTEKVSAVLKLSEGLIESMMQLLQVSREGYVTCVGDMLLAHYSSKAFWLAVHGYCTVIFRHEVQLNMDQMRDPRLARFIASLATVAQTNRRDFSFFLNRIRLFLPQVPLTIKQAAEKTIGGTQAGLTDEQAGTERALLQQAQGAVRDLLSWMDKSLIPRQIEMSEALKLQHLLMWKWHVGIGDAMMVHTLGLSSPRRRIVLDKRVYRDPSTVHDALRLVLTDSALLFLEPCSVSVKYLIQRSTRTAELDDPFYRDERARAESDSSLDTQPHVTAFKFAWRPIPLEALSIGTFDSPPNTHQDNGARFFPFSVGHLGSEAHVIYCTSGAERAETEKAVKDTVDTRKVALSPHAPMQLNLLTPQRFTVSTKTACGDVAPESRGAIVKALVFQSEDGADWIAVATASCVWVGRRAGELQPALLGRNIVDMAVFAPTIDAGNKGTLVVLKNGELWAYALDTVLACVPWDPAVNAKRFRLNPKKREEAGTLRIGKVGNKATMVYQWRRSSSTFRYLHVVPEVAGARARQSGLGRWIGPSARRGANLQLEDEHTFCTDKKSPHSIELYGTDVAVIHQGGVDIVHPYDASKPLIPLPDFALKNAEEEDLHDGKYGGRSKKPEMYNGSALRSEEEELRRVPLASQVRSTLEGSQVLSLVSVARPGMGGRKKRDILLVYEQYGVYVLPEGDSRAGATCRMAEAFRWEGRPQQVVQRGKYIVAVSPQLIEIRKINGRLEQVIPGTNWQLVSGDVVVVPPAGPEASASASRLKPDPPQPILVRQRVPTAVPGYDEQTIFELVLRK